MSNLEILYVIMAGVGIVFLLISIFGGGDADIDLDAGDIDFDISDAESPSDSVSVFSFRTLSTFLLGFGLGGWSVLHGDGGVALQILAGFAVGLLISTLYYFVMRFLYSMQGSSMPTAKDLLGKEGVVTIPTTQTGIAQVKVKTVTGYSEYTCREAKGRKLKQNDTVKVTSVETGVGNITVEKVK